MAYMALNKTYGYHTIACEGPVYDHMEIEKDQVKLYFRHADDGFNRDNGVEGFEIAGKDRRFVKANVVKVESKVVTLSAPGIKQPVAVRYGFHDFQIGNLKNVAELPVVPFRTDNW